MNFILDIGNVLIDFKPRPFLRKLLNDPESEPIIDRTIFKSPEWLKLDAGTITSEEACRIFCAREPGYADLIRVTMEHLTDMLTPMAETVELLPKIKAAGHRLYYLSNYHVKLSRYILNYSFFSLFDGGVFSCDVHLLKPSLAFYEYILKKYNLHANQCYFFDDTFQNITGAEKAGIRSFLFNGACDIKRHI